MDAIRAGNLDEISQFEVRLRVLPAKMQPVHQNETTRNKD